MPKPNQGLDIVNQRCTNHHINFLNVTCCGVNCRCCAMVNSEHFTNFRVSGSNTLRGFCLTSWKKTHSHSQRGNFFPGCSDFPARNSSYFEEMYLCWAINVEVSSHPRWDTAVDWMEVTPFFPPIKMRGTGGWSQRHSYRIRSDPNLVPVGLVSFVSPLAIRLRVWFGTASLPQIWRTWFFSAKSIQSKLETARIRYSNWESWFCHLRRLNPNQSTVQITYDYVNSSREPQDSLVSCWTGD